ncbi:unnamed protein product, partial [marine sediment metagenome]
MKSKINPTILGAFFLGAIAIAFVIIYFMLPRPEVDTSNTYVIYLPGTLKGVHVGSSVTYRGIKIGEVSRIHLQVNPNTQKISIPVYIQLYRAAERSGVRQRRRTQKKHDCML